MTRVIWSVMKLWTAAAGRLACPDGQRNRAVDCRPLDRIDAEDELQITSARADGTLRAPKNLGRAHREDLYVRSVNGRGADWFRHVVAAGGGRIRCSGVECDVKVDERGEASTGAVDDAYLTKYARYGERLVRTMLRPPVVEATLRLVPAATP